MRLNPIILYNRIKLFKLNLLSSIIIAVVAIIVEFVTYNYELVFEVISYLWKNYNPF